ncbi:MAG: queuosine precursor transporter [Chloroflexota bacterium]
MRSSSAISPLLVVVAAVFVTCLIAANTIAVKQTDILGFALPAAVVVFPISYIFGDILTEVYGYRMARRVIWLGFFCNLLFVAFAWIGQLMPLVPPVWGAGEQAAYERILGFTPHILVASFAAYLVGEFANSFVLARMKIVTKGRWLWTRTIGSTIVGQGLDSAIFLSLLAVFGVLPSFIVFGMILNHWLFKTGFEVVATPFTYVVANYLKKRDGVDTYDYDTNFNPLLVTD